jgi:hypothetical protein
MNRQRCFTNLNIQILTFIATNLRIQEREMQKKLRTITKEGKREGKEVKVGYRKITIEGVQWRWNEERVSLEMFQ